MEGGAYMYHVECIDIHKTDKMYLYIDRACLCANNMYNVANFHIRNLMTGLKGEALRKDIQDLPGQEPFCSLAQD